MKRLALLLLPLLLGVLTAFAPAAGAQKKDAKKKAGGGPREPQATAPESLKVAEGFQVELLYSVPKGQQGSWVSTCVDPEGRLYVCDQYGGLFRVTPPPVGKTGEPKIEKVPADIGEAQGLLWAFDSLYVMVNTGGTYESGLYRVTDSDDNDELDTVETLRLLDGRAEHGPHAILLSPDGESLTVVCGNRTEPTDFDRSRVPMVWDEDLILPRTFGRGFMREKKAPGGWIAKVSPDGKEWELISVGFRNEYDAAFNREGELFTYDADMEWDMNTPWYRPTRILHVTSGSEFGWRNSSGKWPAYYEDSLPAVVNVGPGSPTGVTFGYGAKFPPKYEDALFCCDWSYGKLYAVHLKPDGASYTGTLEEFITGQPLPLTDIVVNPHDGAMYFTIGGRRVKSGLYRVTYTGEEPQPRIVGRPPVTLRPALEKLHRKDVPDPDEAIDFAWNSLGSEDRFQRYAARVAIEHRDPQKWQQRALNAKLPWRAITSLIALCRVGDEELQPKILDALNRIAWKRLSHQQKLGLLRAYELAFTRMGKPNEKRRLQVIAKLDPRYPAKSVELNAELTQLLVYLQAPNTARKAVGLLEAAPTQEEQIDYAKSLRHLKTGWTPELQETYFEWFTRAATYRGGASFTLFVQHIKEDAVANLSEEDKARLKPILEAKPKSTGPVFTSKPRDFVKEWTVDELLPVVQSGLEGRDFDRGRRLFGEAKCFACHRYDNQGGAIGPDLTAVSGRFNAKDLLESLIEPSKVVSDQYQAVTIVTEKGKTVTGRIVNLSGDTYRVNTDMLNPDALVKVDRKTIVEMVPSTTSMMPKGLLNHFTKEEILDLVAYLMSRGDRNHAAFRSAGGE